MQVRLEYLLDQVSEAIEGEWTWASLGVMAENRFLLLLFFVICSSDATALHILELHEPVANEPAARDVSLLINHDALARIDTLGLKHRGALS